MALKYCNIQKLPKVQNKLLDYFTSFDNMLDILVL